MMKKSKLPSVVAIQKLCQLKLRKQSTSFIRSNLISLQKEAANNKSIIESLKTELDEMKVSQLGQKQCKALQLRKRLHQLQDERRQLQSLKNSYSQSQHELTHPLIVNFSAKRIQNLKDQIHFRQQRIAKKKKQLQDLQSVDRGLPWEIVKQDRQEDCKDQIIRQLIKQKEKLQKELRIKREEVRKRKQLIQETQERLERMAFHMNLNDISQ